MFEVDPRFKQSGSGARKRRRQVWLLRGGVIGACVGAIGLGFLLWPSGGEDAQGIEDDAFALVQVEEEFDIAAPAPPDVFLNLAGDPVILRFDTNGGDAEERKVSGPAVLDISRFGLVTPDRLRHVRDELVVPERRLMTTLPSTREDFAFFQRKRGGATSDAPQNLTPDLAALTTDVELGDLTDSYGLSLEDGKDTEADIVADTEVENTTSVAFVRREAVRAVLFDDVILENAFERSLASALQQQDLQGAEAVAARIAEILPEAEPLTPGAVLALRFTGQGSARRLVQLSHYPPEGTIGTLAFLPRDKIVRAEDPWIDRDLRALARDTRSDDGPVSGTFRLLDALYSAALRNGMSSELVAELVSLMSKAHDLDRRARSGDKVSLLYAPEHGPNGTAAGQIAHVSIEGPSGLMQCYVVPDRDVGGYTCFDPDKRQPQSGDGAMISPVTGILTSQFGPRKHPIHKVVRLHAGVDWAAPTGTPVYAAAAGKISHAGDGKGYGNLVIIQHPGGLETRYAHLNKFAPDAKPGQVVQAGSLIGYVGTTGRSTGPHLHFETRLNGKPVDPLPLLAGGRTIVASGAVEALVSQIIKVESAGNARAKNPLSSATGLGQFIESTWLRMMRTYRPELATSMSRQDLLNLRFDPTLSREMVTRLAQENEDYLTARGHTSTPGRLYLAHFLGPEGAHRVLSAPREQTILALMGAGVVRANPFLRTYTAQDLMDWADRKMRGRGRGAVTVAAPAPAPPKPIPPEVQIYIDLIDDTLAQTG